jgi:hypothetical protein
MRPGPELRGAWVVPERASFAAPKRSIRHTHKIGAGLGATSKTCHFLGGEDPSSDVRKQVVSLRAQSN